MEVEHVGFGQIADHLVDARLRAVAEVVGGKGGRGEVGPRKDVERDDPLHRRDGAKGQGGHTGRGTDLGHHLRAPNFGEGVQQAIVLAGPTGDISLLFGVRRPGRDGR